MACMPDDTYQEYTTIIYNRDRNKTKFIWDLRGRADCGHDPKHYLSLNKPPYDIQYNRNKGM